MVSLGRSNRTFLPWRVGLWEDFRWRRKNFATSGTRTTRQMAKWPWKASLVAKVPKKLRTLAHQILLLVIAAETRTDIRCEVAEEITSDVRRVESEKPQLTVAKSLVKSRVGLHSEIWAEVKVLPAAAGEGRYFVMRDTHGDERSAWIPAALSYVRDTTLSTWLGGLTNKGVWTVEHLLSALEGIGVDNGRIEWTGGHDVSLLDGSALQWAEAIEEAGLLIALDKQGTSQSRQVPVINESITRCHEDFFVAAFPAASNRLSYGIDFPQMPATGRQWVT